VAIDSDGARYKLLPGEETLTDLNLLQLKRTWPDLVYTEKFTRYREGQATGADWEWWIARRDRWLGMRIQAKRLDPQSQRYELFRADRSKALRQAAMLIEAATAGPERLYPLYCFYNADCPTPLQPRCSPTGDGRVYGCTLLAAPTVRDLVAGGATYYSEFEAHAIPWSCTPRPHPLLRSSRPSSDDSRQPRAQSPWLSATQQPPRTPHQRRPV
jgi:hypothetical protein